MSINQFVLTGLTVLGMATAAVADGRNPGSLLLFPEFDNTAANLTLVTVTNTNSDLVNGSVKVEFVYIGKYGLNHVPLPCLEWNREHTLTPNDTITLITSSHNPQQEEGFLYVFAKSTTTNAAITFNHLIGNLITMEGLWQLDYSMNPVSFLGLGANDGDPTDLDNGAGQPGDGIRDLNGLSDPGELGEYEEVADEILIPRFLGQSSSFQSQLILIGLSGGRAFNSIVNFWIYNDNEEAFSAQYQFNCWDRVYLETISGAFTNWFLKTTNHAAGEIVGATSREAGWMRVYGSTAYSTAEQITDPAIYAVLVERILGTGMSSHGAADLPFESPQRNPRNNGSLFATGPFGDGDPTPVNNDHQ